jgi:hypothetical protein
MAVSLRCLKVRLGFSEAKKSGDGLSLYHENAQMIVLQRSSLKNLLFF